jgi:hypothetical protein
MTYPFIDFTGALSESTVSAGTRPAPPRATRPKRLSAKSDLRIAGHRISLVHHGAYTRFAEHNAVRHEPDMKNTAKNTAKTFD